MWSEYQEAIFNWALKPEGHLMVEASAGSGKTSTIVELYKRLPREAKVIFLAFNKKIATELEVRGVPASTLNAFGYKIIRKHDSRIKMSEWKMYDMAKILGIMKHEVRTMQRLIDLGKAYLYPATSEPKVFADLADEFSIEVKTKDPSRFYENVARMYSTSFNLSQFGIDFSDQISMPTLLDMYVEKYDYVIVDEAQDLAPNKLELVSRAVGKHLICVGDPYQAIYGFCGADSLSMDKIAEKFKPTIMGLPVTYRCGKNIVAECKKHNVGPSDFQAGPENKDGEVRTISHEQFEKEVKAKDYVLCRCTAPLVAQCFKFIKQGIRAVVLGREIGKKLLDFMDKIAEGTQDISEFSSRLNSYRVTEGNRLRSMDREILADELNDKIECVNVFCEGAVNLNEAKERLEKIFDDNVNPFNITLSTIHKAKGLESEVVWILPHKARSNMKEKQKKEEENLTYVAITRAKNQLNWVTTKEKDNG